MPITSSVPYSGNNADIINGLIQDYQAQFGRSPGSSLINRWNIWMEQGKTPDAIRTEWPNAGFDTTQTATTTPETPPPGGTTGDTGGPGATDGSGGPINSDYLLPFTKPFSFEDFSAPTSESMLSDPSYLWRMNQATGAYENSAAARGTLNSGNAPYDIATLSSALASQEYSNVWDRMMNSWLNRRDQAYRDWTTERDTFYANEDRPYQKLYSGGSLGAQAAAAG